MIASTFTEVEQLERRYGISRVDRDAQGADVSSEVKIEVRVDELSLKSTSSSKLPSLKGGTRKFRTLFKAPKSKAKDSGSEESLTIATQARRSPSISGRTTPVASTTALVSYADLGDVPALPELELEAHIPGIDEYINKMTLRAAEYQQTIPTLKRYEWAYTNGEQLGRLVRDLQKYVTHLKTLTRYPVERMRSAMAVPVLQLPAPFSEFKIQGQLPYPRLDAFCGREDTLQEMGDFLTPLVDEKGSICKRAVVVLHGMGGIGKSQIVLEYLYRNPKDYSTVFWVDTTDQSTVRESGRCILQILIAHYSMKHLGDLKFANIATDLGIPGQINIDGLLSEQVAKEPWPSIKRWLTRYNNSGWCIVIDGLNVPDDVGRMQELLPASVYGHVIVTSRVPVPGSKLISVLEMDESSSVKLLLSQSIETASKEVREAAESIAEKLGHLPLALSQAAAYVVTRALDFFEYLRRLRENMAGYVSAKFFTYAKGVFSCWELSVRALMQSTPYAIDLLRLCSFLSPDGVSRELLCRGLSAMEWFENDRSKLDEAVDDLVLYALIKRKSSNIESDYVYWIHPLVRHWAQVTYFDEKSIVLETDPKRLRKLYNNGALKAIRLVGCSLNTTYDNRTASEWSFERRNMANIVLCLNTYIRDCDFSTDEATTAKLALALANFGGYYSYWREWSACPKVFKLSINLYEKLLSQKALPELEAEMLLAKQALIAVYVQWDRLDSNPEDVQALIEETLLGQRRLLESTDAHLLWTECLKASELAYNGKVDEAVSQYGQLVEKLGKALPPGHPINMAAIHNLGNFYAWTGDFANAGKQYEQSLKLFLEHEGPNHQDTHIVLSTVAHFKHETGDLEGELECLKMWAEGSEATYGLASRDAIMALTRLEFWYRKAGRNDEAEAIAQRIHERERILEDANILLDVRDEYG